MISLSGKGRLGAGEPLLSPRVERALAIAARVEDGLHSLHLFGAAGIASFGWATCRLLGVAAEPWLPLWFCAALLVYNFDRLRPDAADRLNIPRRTEAAFRWRRVSLALVLFSVAVLVWLPVLRRDWLSLAAIGLGTPLVLHYSLPLRGRRLKDVPYLKTFFAPTLVTVAVFALPLLREPATFSPLYAPLIAVWGWGLLLANMLLCDARDIPGDVHSGVTSLPSHIGLPSTRRLLWTLALACAGLATQMVLLGPRETRGVWFALAVFPTAYVSGLSLAILRPRSERFYERWVEGLLFLPALLVGLFL